MGGRQDRGTVYFIRPVGMQGPIKIGCSVSPDGRRRTLETWAPFALEIIAEISGGATLEGRFHAAFEEDHQRREWFTWSERMQATVEAINSGSFDINVLPEPKRLTANLDAVRAAHRASWTPARRLEASYSARIRHAQRRTRTVCPVYSSAATSAEGRKRLDAYLADPHAHGETIEQYRARVGIVPWWAREGAAA